MTVQDIEASLDRAGAAEQRAETLQVSLGAARIDVRDLIESCEAARFEMSELRSRAKDIVASFWDLESSSQQQNKENKMIRAHTVRPSHKEGYAGNLPWCNKCWKNLNHSKQVSKVEESKPSKQALERKNLWRL
ncbi:hypothetical protein Tco_1393291 [Tanacetum coccineum]